MYVLLVNKVITHNLIEAWYTILSIYFSMLVPSVSTASTGLREIFITSISTVQLFFHFHLNSFSSVQKYFIENETLIVWAMSKEPGGFTPFLSQHCIKTSPDCMQTLNIQHVSNISKS